MKIIFFTENNRAGGMDKFLVTLLKNWPNNKDELTLICNRDHPGLVDLERELSDKVLIIKHSILLNWSFCSTFISILPNFIQRILRQSMRILLAPYQFLRLKHIFKKLGGDQLLTINGAYPGGETCRLSNIAWHSLGRAQSIHNIHNFAIKPRFIFSWYEAFIDKMLIKSCKCFVAVSQACSDSLLLRNQFNNKNIITIYNGLDCISNPNSERHHILKKLNISEDQKILIMLGTYEKRKGHEFLLKTMKVVFDSKADIHLLICGTGTNNEKQIINSYIQQYTPEKNIHLLGFVRDADKLIESSYILLVPSQEHESFGLTAVEAMQKGVPVITTNVGGLPEAVGEDGVCGYICNKEDIDCFSKKILYLIDNKDIYNKMSINAVKRAQDLFEAKRMVNEYYKLIN
ncbi:MAG: hypothetical protein CMD88_02400 [Gammaproteobacteria bacterium]|nr:hypothetical protein [Gammaproteobacteria bacterium]|tara:strand:- start:557 stop:1765 length:1209 start_codon:yes stop_codon:yes gene_type:complete